MEENAWFVRLGQIRNKRGVGPAIDGLVYTEAIKELMSDSEAKNLSWFARYIADLSVYLGILADEAERNQQSVQDILKGLPSEQKEIKKFIGFIGDTLQSIHTGKKIRHLT